jgi:hypothetical protein
MASGGGIGRASTLGAGGAEAAGVGAIEGW